jgi:hypothetical protein
MGKLVWIASYPKSGSTWVRAFLHNYIRQPETPYDINALMDLSRGRAGRRATGGMIRDRRHSIRSPTCSGCDRWCTGT